MKAKNNVTKAGLRLAAMIAGIFVLSLTAAANSSMKSLFTGYSLLEHANAANDLPSKSKKITSDKHSGIAYLNLLTVEAEEEELELEDWMSNEMLFSPETTSVHEHYSFSSGFYGFPDKVEEPGLEMESWMTDEHYWVK